MKKANENFDKMFSTIKVKMISKETLSEILTTEVGKPVQPWGSVCIVMNKNGKYGVFNDECIGSIDSEQSEDEFPFTFDCYPILEPDRIAMFPSSGVGMNTDEVKQMAEKFGEEQSLMDFMADRYSYNSRIESNMFEFKNWYVTGK